MSERTEEQADMFGLDLSQDLLSGPSHSQWDDRVQWPEALTFMAEHVEHALIELGYQKMQAVRLANVVLTRLAFGCGGRTFYLPRGDALKKQMRDREIWHQFDGRNVDALARHYKLTQMQIYTILKEQRALNANKYQGSLFDQDN